jgi:anti-anti-sigma regulatory factor
MSSKVGCVVPFLLDVGPEKLPAPLAQFHSVPADKEGTWKLFQRIMNTQGGGPSKEGTWKLFQRIMNAQGGGPSGEELRKVFEREWPGLAWPLGLDLRIQLRGDVLVVTPSPFQFEEEEAPGLGERLKALVRGGNKKVILDLAEVKVMSSTGSSLLWRMATFWKEAEMVLANVSPELMGEFTKLRFLEAFKVVPSLDEAIAYLDGSKEVGDG